MNAPVESSRRLVPGVLAPAFDVVDSHGRRIRSADYRGRRLLLAFHRFAACPYCNIRIHRLIAAHPELAAQGLAVVTFFQSPAEIIAKAVGKQLPPFPIVPDPEMHVYDDYGVERSRAALRRALWRRMPDIVASLARGFVPRHVDGDPTLVPADFLVDEAGVLREAYYGRDIGDHMPLERIRTFAATGSSA